MIELAKTFLEQIIGLVNRLMDCLIDDSIN